MTGTCWIATGFFVAWAIFRIFGFEGGAFPVVQLIAYTPYVLLLALPVLMVMLLLRRWPQAGILLLALAALSWMLLPRGFGGGEEAPEAKPVRVLTANLAKGRADSEALVDLAETREADLVLLQEVSSSKIRQLNRSGFRDDYPYQALDATADVGGGAILSRWPLRQLASLAVGRQPRALVAVPGASPIEVVSVHPTAPIKPGTTRDWDHDYESMPAAASGARPLVLGGDFNATLDHRNMRELIGTGYRDAADVTGSGFVPTWPSRPKLSTRRLSLPVTIDHVLAEEGILFSDYGVERIVGSDHRAVFAELLVPPVTEED